MRTWITLTSNKQKEYAHFSETETVRAPPPRDYLPLEENKTIFH